MELGRRLRALRLERRLTQSELGYPMTKSYVSAVERGATLPSLGALLLLAERLGVGADVLIQGVNIRSTSAYTGAHGDETAGSSTRIHERHNGGRGGSPGRQGRAGTGDR